MAILLATFTKDTEEELIEAFKVFDRDRDGGPDAFFIVAAWARGCPGVQGPEVFAWYWEVLVVW